MKFTPTISQVAVLVATVTLSACGGGGDGFPGFRTEGTTTGTTGSTGTTTPAATPTLALALSGGGNSIAASGSSIVQATVKDATGALVDGKLVTFTGNTSLFKFSPASGQVLTVKGVASIQVAPASLSASGAGALSAQAIVAGTTVNQSMDVQLAAANLGLKSLNLGAGSLAAYGNRAISVQATIDDVAATNTPVQVSFNASCGTVTPALVTTDASGFANSTYSADLASCAGSNVTITASAVGATALTGTIPVAASLASNVQFVSVTPSLIYLKDSVGATQAQAQFKVVDSSGKPLQNQTLRMTLSNAATGVSLNQPGNTAPVNLSSDSAGLVSVPVFAGTIPTALNVRATLLNSNGVATSVFSDSNLLTVASGRPTQNSSSLSVDKFSIEGLGVDGQSTTLTLSMADRQGNPVPPGTQVNFVSESGVVQAYCVVPNVSPAVSSCSVTLTSSGTRTANGRVSLLAYTDGEENFVDLNSNNAYDSDEPFTDLGTAFRDDNGQSLAGANGVYDSGEFQHLRTGVSPCVTGSACTTGDGVWGLADVRRQTTVVFASGTAKLSGRFLDKVIILPANTGGTFPASLVAPGFELNISDLNGNSMPTDSTVAVSVTDNTEKSPVTSRTADPAGGDPTETYGSCSLVSQASLKVPSTIFSLNSSVVLKNCTSGDLVNVTVTTPLGTQTSKSFTIP